MSYPVIPTVLPPSAKVRASYDFWRLTAGTGFHIPFATDQEAERKLRNVRSAISFFQRVNPGFTIRAARDDTNRRIVVMRVS